MSTHTSQCQVLCIDNIVKLDDVQIMGWFVLKDSPTQKH